MVLDVETTTHAKGSAFNQQNELVTVQLKVGESPAVVYFKEDFGKVIPILESASVIIGFNLKFDLHWIQREFGWKADCVWDCQLAEFIFSKQTWKYPDLKTACENYGLQTKTDVVKDEYWSKGIQTTDIPREILAEYGANDVEITYQLFLNQLQLFSDKEQAKFKLFRLHCNDLIVLQTMENHGIMYDVQASLQQSKELEKQVKHLEGKIYAFTGSIPINLDSRDHVSILLYGGTISVDTRIPIGTYKTGAKLGQPRYKIIETKYDLPRLVQPLKGSELKKEGYFATDEPTLLSLKPNATTKKLITWLLDRSKLMKLKSTYLEGLPKTIEEMGWTPNMLFSNLNQCVATTGRLSSTKPNQQNLNPEAKRYCITRF